MDKSKYLNTWFKDCADEEAKEIRRADLANAGHILETLEHIISDYEKATEAGRVASKGYANPNWAYKQADTNGEIRAYRRIVKLIVNSS